MLNKQKKSKSNNQGFTIIEVMIVLAIAGLIMVIVFMAMPALRRTSNNTQSKNEASLIAAAIGEYQANNGGKSLTAGASTTGGTNDASKILAGMKLTTITTLVIEASATTTTTLNGTTAIIKTGAKCTASSVPAATNGTLATGSTIQGPSTPRSIAILYAMEDAAGNATGCLEA